MNIYLYCFSWSSHACLFCPVHYPRAHQVEVTVLWWLVLRLALVRRVLLCQYGPIVVYSEFRAHDGVCAIAGGKAFVVRPFFGGECMGKPIIPARDSYYNCAFLWSSWSRVMHAPGNPFKFSAYVLSSISRFQFIIVFSFLYFVVALVVSFPCLTSITSHFL